MRNDANDDFDNVPSLRADIGDDDDFVPTPATSVRSRSTPVVKVKSASTGPLWALVGALLIAFAGLAWWSFQQISLMGQQLVATQESFARISEEAAGRLQDISGKVVASEASVNNGSEALKLQIKQLETQLLEQSKQQVGVAGQATELDKRLAQMTASTTDLSTANAKLQGQVQALTDAVATLKAAQVDASKRDTEIRELAADVAALKKQGNPSAAVARLEQDVMVLKSAQDNQSANSDAPTNKEFDVFRIQTTRNITTLQSQVQNLNQRLNAPAAVTPLIQ
ncbi:MULTISPECIES: ATPase [unclassified Pseudomonas]|jgi:chromosome segregation ATPase|uniref:ATPase n=1 Tax=Pseudomonas gorinensis TaxID=3240790 RepID=A0ACA7PCA6_9PSED|nr:MULTISPECIES: ATPase [unclassified Pseudomonas]AHC37522.1 ATPase [Pseudomonas sp. TKP]MBL1310275.1 ATPase [Pseudomonas sp.]PMX19071.1 ATPase [Pseudomonas sp. MPBC4-3]PMX50032.1 ATPase [Pseudomonas sp. FW301-21B01]PMY10748.1 ATPase [Pseudomonas sp. MPR-R5A]